MPPAEVDREYWTMYLDGSKMKKGADTGVVFVSPLGVRMRYTVRLHFHASNNVADYEALVNGLRIATELSIQWLEVHDNSQLVIDQVMKASSCHSDRMAVYLRVVRRLENKFDGLELNYISRKLNEATYALTKMASRRELVPTEIFASDQHKPSIHFEEPEQLGNKPLTPGLGAGQSSASPDLLASGSGDGRSFANPDPPSMGSGAGRLSYPPDPEVMELDEEPMAEPAPPTD